MRNTYIVTRSFRFKNREAFDLSVVDVDFGPGNSHMYLIKSVILPFQLINKFYALLDENKIPENDTYDFEYCNDLLDTIAEYIMEENKLYNRFFYPVHFLDENNLVKDEFIKKYDSAKKEIRQTKYGFFDETSIKVLFLKNVTSLINAMHKTFYLQKKTISRKEFELCIQNFETGSAYTNVYHDLVKFILIFSKKTKKPVCAIAYCSEKTIKFGIITGTESISI
jgi:hypothetical protein